MKFSQAKCFVIIMMTVLGILIIPACRNTDDQSSSSNSDVFQKINDYLDLEEENGFSGVISIKIKNQQVYTRSMGYASEESEFQNTKKTVFDIGSLTKQFTAAAILKLEMEGNLNVSDSLSRFFPDIPIDKKSITIHQLLTHTSGLKKYLARDYSRTNKADFLKSLFSSELRCNPGDEYFYSNAGYSLLGVIIEKVSEKDYESYLNEKLFLPADMKQTGYVQPHWDEENIAHGYRSCRDWGKPMDMPWSSNGPYWNLHANAGLLSSSQDIIAWLDALEGNNILNEEAKKKLFFPHVREGENARSYYSYGWVKLKSSRETIVTANRGGNRRFYSDILRYKTEDVTILLLSNKDKPGIGSITTEIAKIIFWPKYGPEVQSAVQSCLDSLPDNRIGEVTGKFLALIDQDEEIKNQEKIDEIFSDYLKNKRTPEYILNILNWLRENRKNITIRSVVITDYHIMDLYLYYKDGENKKKLLWKFVFDDEDDYLIRSWVNL